MDSKNHLTRFLRVIIHFWWYLSWIMGAIIIIVFVGKETKRFESNWISFSFPVQWKLELKEPSQSYYIRLEDRKESGNHYDISEVEAIGSINLGRKEGMQKLSVLYYTYFTMNFAIGIFCLYQLRKLFDNIAKGHYFEELNALRIRWISFGLFGIFGIHLFIQLLFDLLFSSNTPAGVDIGGLRLGLNPIFVMAFFLLALAEVFREGTKLKAEQDLTV